MWMKIEETFHIESLNHREHKITTSLLIKEPKTPSEISIEWTEEKHNSSKNNYRRTCKELLRKHFLRRRLIKRNKGNHCWYRYYLNYDRLVNYLCYYWEKSNTFMYKPSKEHKIIFKQFLKSKEFKEYLKLRIGKKGKGGTFLSVIGYAENYERYKNSKGKEKELLRKLRKTINYLVGNDYLNI